MGNLEIITVGISPCWDRTCLVHGLNWGDHKKISSQILAPAGKALNICKALAWLDSESTAAGLWGKDDYQAMLKAIEPLKEHIKIKFTQAPGQTRQNITIIDTAEKKEMHLRAPNALACPNTLRQLSSDLKKIVTADSICVFAGAIPDGNLLGESLSTIETAKNAGGKIVVDTSGPGLKSIVDKGRLYLIKPNIEELSELVSADVANNTDAIITAASTLLDKVEIILVSRGKDGAVLVTKDLALEGYYFGDEVEVCNTVACGDFLLAGFLSAEPRHDLAAALELGIKVASARAWGWTEQLNWAQVQKKISVKIMQNFT